MLYVVSPRVIRLINLDGKYLVGMKGCFSTCPLIAASLLVFYRFLISRLGTDSERLSPAFGIDNSSKS